MKFLNLKSKDSVRENPPETRAAFLPSVAAVIGGQVACAVVALVTEICYARLLGPEPRGQISLCVMSIALGILVAGMGGEGAIILWSADSQRNAKVWLPAVLLWGFLGCLSTSVLWVLVYWKWHPSFLRNLNPTLALIVLVSIPVGVFFDYQVSMLAGQERFRTRAGVTVVSQFAGLAGFALLLYFARSAQSAMWGNLFGLLAGCLIAGVILRSSFRGFWKIAAARPNLLPTLSFAMRGQFGLVASFFNYRLDVFVVNYFLNTAQLGLYALGVIISEALWQIPAAAAVALFPRTARTLEAGAERFTSSIIRQVLVIATVGAMVIGIGSSLFLPLIFGERFRASIAIVWLLLPGTVALSLGRVAASDLSGRGKSGYSSVFSTVALLVTIGLDFFLIPRIGIQGAAIASSAAYSTNALLLLSALKYELKISWKNLLLPGRQEWTAYSQAWLRLREGFRTAAAIPSRQPD
jgi:O-antigen/teichoic acid export membrane protein